MKVFLAALVVFLAMVGSGFIYGYIIQQDLLKESNNTKQAWADTQNAYDKRAALVTELLKSTAAFSFINKVTITTLNNRQREVLRFNINPAEKSLIHNYQKFLDYQKIQNDLSKALNQFWTEISANPDFKADLSFVNMQNDLMAITKNIHQQKINYNKMSGVYNSKVLSFPTAIIALTYGFEGINNFNNTNLDPQIP